MSAQIQRKYLYIISSCCLLIFLALPRFTQAYISTDYLPLAIGNSWTFNTDGTTMIETIQSTKLINGVTTFVYHSPIGESYVTNDSNGIMEHGSFIEDVYLAPGQYADMTMKLSPAMKYTNYIMNVGDVVTCSGIATFEFAGFGIFPLNYTASSHLVGVENVTVPYGSFTALRLEITLTVWGSILGTPFNMTAHEVDWLAKYLGFVKKTITVDDITETSVLVDTNIVIPVDADDDGYSASTDCNDGDSSIHPDATEICDGQDNDCDGDTDEGLTALYYADTDDDGYGDPSSFQSACSLPAGYVTDSTDCDDSEFTTNPGAEELAGDGVDNNCDGQIDVGAELTVPTDHDFNGDGMSDMLLHSTNSGLLWRFRMDAYTIDGSNSVAALSTDWQVAGVSDFDGDKNADILLKNSGGLLYLFHMNDNAIKSSTRVSTLNAGENVVGTADFTGDQLADILILNSLSGTLSLMKMNGSGVFEKQTITNLASIWEIASTADFNGDGKADILLRNSNGLFWIYQMDGHVISSSNGIALLNANWQVGACADYDGDGNDDILLHNDANGLYWLFQMNGNSIEHSRGIAVLSTIWGVVGGGDYNGDGLADIMLRNKNTGLLWMLEMSGNSITNSRGVALLDSAWQVAK